MKRSRTRFAFALAVLLIPASSWGYYAAGRHISYYSGTEAHSRNCLPCHLRARGGFLDRLLPPHYQSPLNLAISRDGQRLYVTAQESDSLLVVDLTRRRPTVAIPVGHRPHSVALSPDGRTAYVSNQWSDSISIVDLVERQVAKELPVGHLPTGVALDPMGNRLYVANLQSDSISILDLESGTEHRVTGGSSPNQMALAGDGSRLVVSNELSFVGREGDIPVSELTVIDPRAGRVTARYSVPNAHLLEGVAFTPAGDLALVALVRPKNLLPAIQVARGWMMNNGLGILELSSGRLVQLLLDEVDASYADPYGLAVSPDGRLLFVSHSGVDRVSVVDLERLRRVLAESGSNLRWRSNDLGLSPRYVLKRIATGSCPKGLVVSPDGRFLFVAEHLDDAILAVDLDTLEPAFRVALGHARESVRRRGEKVFNSAAATFQGQFSCRSCHPENHVDRLRYDFEPDGLGRNLVDNRSLLGIRGTAPFKWNGRNTSLFMQCGVRFARILTRLEPFSTDDLSALVAFIRSLSPPPNPFRRPDGSLTESQERGRVLFERLRTRDGRLIAGANRCVTCHPPPSFTDRHGHDVGTGTRLDSTRVFDTPQLRNIYASAPYLHDGRARTLEEIWTLYNPEDRHGFTSDMNKRDLNDLIEYLRSL